MHKFYREATGLFVILMLITCILIYVGSVLSEVRASFLPIHDSDIPWTSYIEPPEPKGGTRVEVKLEAEVVDYNYVLSSTDAYPYASYAFYFNGGEDNTALDLTRYDTVRFNVTCEPQNVLLFVLFTHDDKVTVPRNRLSHRVNSAFFSCDATWQPVQIRLAALVTPDWWLSNYGHELSDQQYDLKRAYGFSLVNSLQSPLATPSRIKITDVELRGENKTYLYVFSGIAVFCWVVFFAWQFHRYVNMLVAEVRAKVSQDRPFIAYKKLSIAPQKDKEKSAVLRYMATEYPNPDLSLELAVAALGINRTKINEILKEELGLTFNTYINKLRLTEAARLLSENGDASVSEIAYSVGYNNVSYFNKLFKTEYGCTPKTFKQLYQDKSSA